MKIGRNDLCPCGSGKKYKFCCLKKENNMKSEIIKETQYEYGVLFDDNEKDITLNRVYSLIWYIMHLPRNIYDFLPINKRTEAADRINAHNIVFVPCSRMDIFNDYKFTLVIAEAICKEKAVIFMQSNKPEIGVFIADELSDQLLRRHWKELYNSLPANMHGIRLEIIFDAIGLFEKNQRLGLTLFYMNNWLNAVQDLKRNIHVYLDDYYTEILKLRNNMVLYENIDLKNCPTINKVFNCLCPYIQLPITLSLAEKGNSNQKSEAIELAGIHNAISNNGAYIRKESDLSILFVEIRNIENSLKEAASGNVGAPRAYSIWKSLNNIGKKLYELFSEEERAAIERASQIVAFSNFPIGLAVFPNHSAPLCCYKKIAYRHLEPAVAMVITEMSGHIIQDMTKGLKILMLECIDRKDPIRKISDEKLREPLKELCNKKKDFYFIYKEALSVEKFYMCINETEDVDILLISAHGFYDEGKYSGIYVGNEKLLKIERMSRIPKFVMFSACHVCPRGNKAYSIVEQMLQKGVLAVLGTNVPVDVCRNANLFLRFIVAILSSQNGENPFNTVLDVWQHIMSSNAVYEIKESNKRVKQWLDSGKKMVAFQCRANKEGIRHTDIYTDTLEVLIGMADEEQKRSLEDVKKQKNYFPESIFYELNGFPENIIVNRNTGKLT